MRVTQSLNQAQFLAALTQLESNLSQTQNQVSSNLAFTSPAQNPVAAGRVNNYDQALAQSQQYDSNANSAQSRLGTEDSALAQVQTELQSLRDLALQANNSSVSSQGRTAIAAQAAQIQNSLISLANTQDGNGEYIFGGFSTNNQPFTLTASGANYAGDQGQRQVQIAAGQTIADGDNGNSVFNQIKTGNGTFRASAAAGNTGTGVLGASTVQNPAAYNGGTYAINFIAANTYEVRDSANVLVTSGTYTDGQSIAFRGVQVTLTGQPATGDSFTVAPSSNQSLFTTVQNLVNALQVGGGTSAAQAKLNNSLGDAINSIDQGLGQTSNVRATIGARLNSITTQLSVSSSQQIQLKASISSLQSLDYAAAITTLDLQNTTLSASMQAYTLTQGLTLFKYI
jgi:flagellar hook-associated protein 3 FlgL